DVGPTRVERGLAANLRQQLQAELERPLPEAPRGVASLVSRLTGVNERRKEIFARRLAAANALGRIESGSFGTGGQYWSLPHGEPKWVTIPAGEFWMGSEKGREAEKPLHRLHLPEYQIAITPVTNAQYSLYLMATGAKPPSDWDGDLPPKGKESHPVVRVTWHDAIAYCAWLSKATGKQVTLPSEAEWEKAARGHQDQREYPWGNEFDPARCNTDESGIGTTTPVGIYPTGASPYGVLDLSGNVWEWCSSLYKEYPYQAEDGREDMGSSGSRVLRGGAFDDTQDYTRCAFRYRSTPLNWFGNLGFRVCVRWGLSPTS
ncbi:MAG: formylglycine-generating enzyme family protein, partial [Chloroflexi bacterium]|nr:formylglycine-generating enzyme family protein [Chloroflexota bacterium]